jgi:hypothetical protein
LTGRNPQEFLAAGMGAGAARAATLNLALLDGVCRPVLKQLIERCLHPDPEHRFADAQKLHDALSVILRGS